MSTATQMTAGYDHTCARLGDGSAKCWGGIRLGNGDGTVSTSKVPVSINTSPGIPLQGVLQISAGTGHTCAIVTGNTAKCWGDNLYGQLGNGGTAGILELPVDVVGLNGVPLADVVRNPRFATAIGLLVEAHSQRLRGRKIAQQTGFDVAGRFADALVDHAGK